MEEMTIRKTRSALPEQFAVEVERNGVRQEVRVAPDTYRIMQENRVSIRNIIRMIPADLIDVLVTGVERSELAQNPLTACIEGDGVCGNFRTIGEGLVLDYWGRRQESGKGGC